MASPVRHHGKWRIRWFDHTGKRQSVVFGSKKEAEQALRLVEGDRERIKLGLVAAPPPVRTFEDLARYWEEHKLPGMGSEDTLRSHLRRHMRPFFGDMLLTTITVEETRAFGTFVRNNRVRPKNPKRGWKRRPLGTKTIHNVLTHLKSMLNEAGPDGLKWLLSVPKVPRPKLEEVDFTFLDSLEEVEDLIHAAGEELPGTDVFYAMAAYTGMRAGEIAGLTKRKVDLKRRLITVAASYDKSTKSKRVRHVPILDPLLPRLREWKIGVHGPLMFANSAGNMRQKSDRIFQETLHRCLQRAGLGRIRFHDLRHTFASHWVMKGGDLFKLQKILGHSTPQMTLRYAHLAPGAFESDWGRFGAGPGAEATITDLSEARSAKAEGTPRRGQVPSVLSPARSL